MAACVSRAAALYNFRVAREAWASAGRSRRPVLLEHYFQVPRDGLRLRSTVKKQVNVVQNMAGYFKNQLSSDGKKELLDVIDQYHKGLVPLIIPVTLIKYCARKYDEPYLKRQYYLNPHPMELMLRNRV